MFEKFQTGEKNPWCTKTASNLQPFDLCSNAYRSLPGDQDIFSLLFSCIYIHRNPRKWLIIFILFYLFINALQHKCWRSVGHQVLQPAKDVEFRTVCLKSCILKYFLWNLMDIVLFLIRLYTALFVLNSYCSNESYTSL